MTKTLSTVNLIDLIPDNLKNDPDVIAVFSAYQEQFSFINDLTPSVYTMADVENASEAILDNLAVQMNIDFYDTSLLLEQKRDLVESGYLVQYQKGTKFAVKQALSAKYATTDVEEWFEYGGSPFFFKITTDIPITDPDILADVVATVEKVKNVRSVLESVFLNGTLVLGEDDLEISIDEGLANAAETQGGILGGVLF